jgi:hypothetical protein
MTPELLSKLVAYWGAGISTILGGIKLWEIWRDRFRLDVDYNFAGNEEVGNKILLRNLSGRPIIISYWELFYSSGRWPRRKFEGIQYRDHDAGDTRVSLTGHMCSTSLKTSILLGGTKR